MPYFSYIVVRDCGFSPNPFYGLCTLAICKPAIRSRAHVGDWVFGLSPSKKGNRLIYAMQVTEKISFDRYWHDNRYAIKKPDLDGDLKAMMGDNIYHRNAAGDWQQADSHHSNPHGNPNFYNLNRDAKSPFVLLSTDFYFFGEASIVLPFDLVHHFSVGIGHRKVDAEPALAVIEFLRKNYDTGRLGLPSNFTAFYRYDGRS